MRVILPSMLVRQNQRSDDVRKSPVVPFFGKKQQMHAKGAVGSGAKRTAQSAHAAGGPRGRLGHSCRIPGRAIGPSYP